MVVLKRRFWKRIELDFFVTVIVIVPFLVDSIDLLKLRSINGRVLSIVSALHFSSILRLVAFFEVGFLRRKNHSNFHDEQISKFLVEKFRFCLKEKVEQRIRLSLELNGASIFSEDEVRTKVVDLLENLGVREEFLSSCRERREKIVENLSKKLFENESKEENFSLASIQKENPRISVVVKTSGAIRTIFNSSRNFVENLAEKKFSLREGKFPFFRFVKWRKTACWAKTRRIE